MTIIDDTKRVKVTTPDGREHPLELLHMQGHPTTWKVAMLHGGAVLGTVEKTSYTYSPPTHKGSRIARSHQRVKSWQCHVGFYPDTQRGIHHRTRKDALIELIEGWRERQKLLKKLDRLRHSVKRSNDHFKLNRPATHPGAGRTGRLLVDGPVVTLYDAGAPESEKEERVHMREIENDMRPCLEFRNQSGRWEPVANILWSMED